MSERTSQVRRSLAQLVRWGCAIPAVLLAAGALILALRGGGYEGGAALRVLLRVNGVIDGPFDRSQGLLSLPGGGSGVEVAVLNWGAAALIYLILGRLLWVLLTPRRRSQRA